MSHSKKRFKMNYTIIQSTKPAIHPSNKHQRNPSLNESITQWTSITSEMEYTCILSFHTNISSNVAHSTQSDTPKGSQCSMSQLCVAITTKLSGTVQAASSVQRRPSFRIIRVSKSMTSLACRRRLLAYRWKLQLTLLIVSFLWRHHTATWCTF